MSAAHAGQTCLVLSIATVLDLQTLWQSQRNNRTLDRMASAAAAPSLAWHSFNSQGTTVDAPAQS